MARLDLLATPGRRRLLFGALYLSEGAPIGFLWWFLPTRLREAGVPLADITALTASLVLPWTLKFLWAPAIDALRARGGTFRAWILGAQGVMVLTLAPLLALDLAEAFGLVTALLLVHSVAAATQDVAVDGLAIATTGEHERGALNGWMQAGMLLGRSLFGGVALIVAARLEPAVVPAALLVAVAFSLVLVALAREAPGGGDGARTDLRATVRALVRRPTTWLALGFGLISGAGFEGVGAVAGPFLIDRGLDSAAVGGFLALPAVGAMLAGALAGGFLSDRIGRRRAVALFLIVLTAAIAGLAAAAAAPGTTGAFVMPLLAAVYFGIGLFTASSYALFMDVTDPRLGATQFSAAMAATNACEAWAAFAVGRLATGFGYPAAFVILAGVSLLSLPLLARLVLPRAPQASGAGRA